MLGVLTSLLFAGAFIAAIAVILAMFQSHGEKMMAALRMQRLGRQPAPWRVPPRRPVRTETLAVRVVRKPRLSVAA